MKVFIAEDEAPARERLVESLARVAPDAVVVGTAASVRDTQAWLAGHPPPDLLLLDIQLSDGLSLELFRGGTLACPTVFTTAYDEHVLDAFQARAIDYLLKPVDEARLAAALAKLAQLRRHFTGELGGLLDALQAPRQRFRQRIVGRLGAQHHAIAVERIAYFVSADKLAHAVTHDGARYLLDAPLADLEPTLDPARFFRANRQLVVAASAVASFRAAGKGRIALTLQPPLAGDVAVSQERAAAFRQWLAQ
jgi:DNA-binding LytR/AlgR family response regulator